MYWKRQAPRYAYGALLARSVDLYVVFSLIPEQSPKRKGPGPFEPGSYHRLRYFLTFVSLARAADP